MNNESDARKQDQITSKVLASFDGEINWLNLWNVLVRWKTLVITVGLVTFVIIIAYGFINIPTPVYQVKVFLSKPSKSNIGKIPGYTLEKAFNVLVRNMSLRPMRLRYFKENNLLDKLVPDRSLDAKQAYEKRFYNMLTINGEGEYMVVVFKGANAKLTSELVNGFVAAANKWTVHDLIQAEISRLSNQKIEVEKKMNALRLSAKWKREVRIQQLEEMALIAEHLGIKDILNSGGGVYLPKMPEYLMGSKVLLAEASVLSERKSDDPFISEMYNLKSKLADLQSESAKWKHTLFDSDFSNVAVSQVVHMASIPDKPINPPAVFKRFMLNGILAGLVLGVLAAFFADFIVRVRDKKAVQAGQGLAG